MALRIKPSKLGSSHSTGVPSTAGSMNFSHEKASLDAAEGAMLGVCVGDAAGAPLEFPRSARITEEKVEQAMRMLGGGVFQPVGPGQGTDDTELMLCLAQSLATSQPSSLPLNEIAQAYCDWASTGPLDIGSTCEKAFSRRLGDYYPQVSQAASCAAIAKQWNSRSETNDALNRVVPLAIWAWREKSSVIAHLAGLEASLSHPSPTVKDCNAAYCIAVAHLLKQPSCAEAAFQAALKWAKAEAGHQVVTWLEEAQDLHYCPCVNTRAGWIKWGFLYAFRHLHMRSSFEAALRDTLSRGGDVDTNAAIVGGMMGALHGASGIPASMQNPVLARTAESSGKRVPEHLCASRVPGLAKILHGIGDVPLGG